MPTSLLEATVRERGATAVIDLRGEINSAAEADLTAAYDDAVSRGSGAVLLNFADVVYINSTGIALIVGILARARTEGRTVHACNLLEHYRDIFQITRLSDFMPMFTDEESAVAAR